MQAFPEPERPSDAFWKSQEASMKDAAKEEYIRLLHTARKLGKLRVVKISKPGFSEFYDVQYTVRASDPKRPDLQFVTMSVKPFIKKKDAERFRDFALSDREIPRPPSELKREKAYG